MKSLLFLLTLGSLSGAQIKLVGLPGKFEEQILDALSPRFTTSRSALPLRHGLMTPPFLFSTSSTKTAHPTLSSPGPFPETTSFF